MGIKHILSYSLIFIGTLLLSAKNADTTDMANYINRYTLSGITMQDGLPALALIPKSTNLNRILSATYVKTDLTGYGLQVMME